MPRHLIELQPRHPKKISELSLYKQTVEQTELSPKPRPRKASPLSSSVYGDASIMTSAQVLLSPAELAYLHASLSLHPPIRPDGRAPTQFRPLTAETGFLPGTNGSARVCFSDGTEAVVGVKAEVEKTPLERDPYDHSGEQGEGRNDEDSDKTGNDEWVEMAVEIPGSRDDDAGTVFLASMLSEALLADGSFAKKLYINRRFHWKLYLDVRNTQHHLSTPFTG